MKLIDMLVKETIENGLSWPDGYNSIAQDEYHGDLEGDIYAYIHALNAGNYWFEDNDSGYGLLLFNGYEVAEDAGTSLVTREQYEAALAAKNEGWIELGSGECPVPDDTEVLIKCKSEGAWDYRHKQLADGVSWTHDDSALDVIAYRLHKPQEAVHGEAGDEVDLNECIGQTPAPVCNGEGLPPLGCECEYSLNGGKTWWKCKVDYIVGTQGVVMLCDTFEGVQYVQFSLYGNALKFRPIRTEAECKRDAAIEEMIKIATIHTTKHLGLDLALNSIYDAIADGKIPGVKLED